MSFEPTPEQARAIRTFDRPLSIAAGAGSGKTRVLAQRFVVAVDPRAPVPAWRPAPLESLLAITFTDKAASELAERVRRVLLEEGLVDLARRADVAWISTIHGFCARILRRHALEAGVDPAFGVLSGVDAGLLRELAFEDVASAALAEDEGVRGLVGEYGLPKVRDAVEDLHGRLRAMGRSVSDVAPEPAPDLWALVEDAADAYAGAASDSEAAKPCKSRDTNLTCFSRVAADLGRLLDRGAGASPQDTGREAWRIVRDGKGSAQCGADLKETVWALRARRLLLLQSFVAVVAAPHAEALLGLASRFEERYARLKAEAASLDFEDLLLRALALLECVPELADRYRNAFRLVMVDEFQDTNDVQARLVERLADGTLCIVGDERQSIYAFRYADVDVFRRKVRALREAGAAEAVLSANFRSHPEVLGFVNALFGRQRLFGSGLLRLEARRAEPSGWPGGARIAALFVDDGGASADDVRRAEARAVAGRLRELVDSGVRAGDVVVLLRALTPASSYAEALRDVGLPCLVVGGGAFLGRPAVRALRTLLRSVVNTRDEEAVGELLAGPLGALSDDALHALRRGAGAGSLWDADPPALGAEDAAALRALHSAVAEARAGLGRKPLSETLLRAMEHLGYDLALLASGLDGAQSFADALKLARLADEFEAQGGTGPAAFLEHLSLKERFGEREAPAATLDEDADVVRLMTVHGAKGLEFPVVAVPELGRDPRADAVWARLSQDDGGLGLALALPAEGGKEHELYRSPAFAAARELARESDIGEEKRLLYVACTRAREALVLSGAADFSKPADRERPIDWLRDGLDLGLPGQIGDAVVEVAPGVAVDVRAHSADEGEQREQPAPEPPRADAPPPRGPSVSGAEASVAAPETVSFTDLASWEACPFAAYATRVLRVGVPNRQGSAASFGDAVHAALELSRGEMLPPERLEALGRRHRLSEADRARLSAALVAFERSHAWEEAAAKPRLDREVPFAVPLGGPLLVGKIDLLASGEGEALVVDYKTGTSAPDVESYRVQAECYALAVLAGGAERVDVAFVRLEEDEGGRPVEVRFPFVAADMPALRGGLEAAAREYASANAVARPDHAHCARCTLAGGLCPVTLPRGAGGVGRTRR